VAMTKYEHLVKPLSIGAMNWDKGALAIGPGNASREVRLSGRDHLEGMNLNFSWGVHTGLGEWHAGLDPHVHPYPECLLFVGLDSANVHYLGAEIDCCLGVEQEIYTFNEPTVIVIPAGVPHGPITTKRMFSPRGFGFWAIELNSVSEITWLGEGISGIPTEQRKAIPEGMKFAATEKILRNKPTQATGKYAHLVKSLKPGLLIERGKYNSSRFTPEQLAQQEERSKNTGEKPGPGNTDHLTWMCGHDLENLNVNFFWGFSSQSGIWRRGVGAHVHPTDEVLVYLGIDPNDMDYLGAEIEIDLGQEHERHVIDQPTVVICPAGTPHMPQITRWVDKPFAFFAINLSAGHETKAFDLGPVNQREKQI
jgi:hypothetical protein